MDEKQDIIIYRTADGRASVALYAKDGKISPTPFPVSLCPVPPIVLRPSLYRCSRKRGLTLSSKVQNFPLPFPLDTYSSPFSLYSSINSSARYSSLRQCISATPSLII